MPEYITLQDDQQAYQEHQNSNFINDMHGLNVHILRPIGVFLSKEVPSYFTQLKEFFKPVFLWCIAHIKISRLVPD